MEAIYLSVAVCIAGLIVYVVSDKPKIELIGRWAYGIGLAAVLLQFGGYLLATVRH